jgi:hypothetical protein
MSEHSVIDEPRLADLHRQSENRGALNVTNFLERFRVT